MADFRVRDEGTIVVFAPEHDDALEWLQTHTDAEGWQWMGSALCVDHRPAQALLDGILSEGWEVMRG